MLRKYILEKNTLVRKCWAMFRSHQLENRYRSLGDKYRLINGGENIYYDPSKVIYNIKDYAKDVQINQREEGEIHSAIMVLNSNWGRGMVDELSHLGRVSVYDWTEQGYPEDIGRHHSLLEEMNYGFFEFIKKSNRFRSIDWVFLPSSGAQILRATIRRIRQELGIPVVNQWLDCKQNFECGVGPYGQDSGQKDIAPEFDLVWTSSRSLCEWYLAVGARPIFLPEGFSPQLTPRLDCEKKYEVGFLGACYGLRPDYIKALRKAGLKVVARGFGWPGAGSVPLTEMGRFFGECKVNLGMGGVGYSMELTTLKGRDFEVPGAGGAYLTTYNADLANFFHIGREILCYHSIDEMVELACRLVQHDDFREELAARAYARSMQEHRWLHRFQVILEILGILNSKSGNGGAPCLTK
ncbi:MAG: glycosyltransferase [Desulfobaccales bacterium]